MSEFSRNQQGARGHAPGQVKEITSLANPIVKDIKALALRKHRDESGRFMAEGLKLVTDALEDDWTVHIFLHAKSAGENRQVQAVAAKARARGATILEVSEKVLGSIARRDNPQMAIGVFGQRWTQLNSIRPAAGDLWVALDRVRDPGNLGTIIRTADAVGANGLILIGETTDPYSLEAVRATMGSIFAISLARAGEAEFLSWRSKWPGLVVGTHLEGAVDYRTPDYGKGPVLLVMGNEQQGLTPALAAACDRLCRIPQAGRADSLNLAVATGVMLFEIRRPALTLGDGAS